MVVLVVILDGGLDEANVLPDVQPGKPVEVDADELVALLSDQGFEIDLLVTLVDACGN